MWWTDWLPQGKLPRTNTSQPAFVVNCKRRLAFVSVTCFERWIPIRLGCLGIKIDVNVKYLLKLPYQVYLSRYNMHSRSESHTHTQLPSQHYTCWVMLWLFLLQNQKVSLQLINTPSLTLPQTCQSCKMSRYVHRGLSPSLCVFLLWKGLVLISK